MRLKSTIHSKNLKKYPPLPRFVLAGPLCFLWIHDVGVRIYVHILLIYTQQTNNVSAVVLAPLLERLAYW